MFNVKEELENQEREIAKLTETNSLLKEDNIKITKKLLKRVMEVRKLKKTL